MTTISTGRALLDAPALLHAAGLGAKMQYADLGAGTLGHFVFPASDMVGQEGQVYAVDILKSALAGIEGRMRLESVNNITALWGDLEQPGGVRLADHSLDLASLVNVTGLALKSPSVIQEMKRLLKSGGRAMLIDWQKAAGGLGPPPEKRVSAEEMSEIMITAGFQLEKQWAAGPYHWGLLFRKP